MACGGSRPPNKVCVGEMNELMSEGLSDFHISIKQRPDSFITAISPGVSNNQQGREVDLKSTTYELQNERWQNLINSTCKEMLLFGG